MGCFYFETSCNRDNFNSTVVCMVSVLPVISCLLSLSYVTGDHSICLRGPFIFFFSVLWQGPVFTFLFHCLLLHNLQFITFPLCMYLIWYPGGWYENNYKKYWFVVSSSKDAFLEYVFQMTAIAFISVINRLYINELHLFWDTMYLRL